jgi:2-haloacid dehalogenase
MVPVSTPPAVAQVKALTFDVFGTVVDWRGSIIRDGEELTRRTGVKTDWGAFAEAWRGQYAPSMRPIRNGERAWVNLDVLHWENLLATVERLGSIRGPTPPRGSRGSSGSTSS